MLLNEISQTLDNTGVRIAQKWTKSNTFEEAYLFTHGLRILMLGEVFIINVRV